MMKKKLMIAGIIALALLGAVGIAQAAPDDENGTDDFTSTQSPTQVLDAVLATLGEANFGFMDALNGDNRPDGANGVESEFPPADPRFVEGPVGGLLNGPQD